MSDYLQHGSRHRGGVGSDPIDGIGLTNDWLTAQVSASVTNTSSPGSPSFVTVPFPGGSTVYQTDDGSIYGELAGGVDAIEIKAVGSYIVRVIGFLTTGLSGFGGVDAVIGGPVTTYDYNTPGIYPLSWSGTGGGKLLWEELVTVNDLSSSSAAYARMWQSSGSTQSATVTLQILRLT